MQLHVSHKNIISFIQEFVKNLSLKMDPLETQGLYRTKPGNHTVRNIKNYALHIVLQGYWEIKQMIKMCYN